LRLNWLHIWLHSGFVRKEKEVALRERFTKKKSIAIAFATSAKLPENNEKRWHNASPHDLTRLVVPGDVLEIVPAVSGSAKGLALVKEETVRCTPRSRRHALQTLPQTVAKLAIAERH
jgi:hypothetical protein